MQLKIKEKNSKMQLKKNQLKDDKKIYMALLKDGLKELNESYRNSFNNDWLIDWLAGWLADWLTYAGFLSIQFLDSSPFPNTVS